MTSAISAIETRYAGCNFRSRLEARWAVFFDTLGIAWQYEPQGFIGCAEARYLPDFFLPEVEWCPRGTHQDASGVYVEVKGSDEQLRQDSERIGECIDYHSTPLSRHGLLILGDIPRADLPDCVAITHSLCYWYKGVATTQVGWEKMWPKAPWSLSARPPAPAPWMDDYTAEDLPEATSTIAVEWRAPTFRRGTQNRVYGARAHMAELVAAYRAARSARFEHGQSGPT